MPWAEAGIRQTSRCASPRLSVVLPDAEQARAYSPCEPALGCSETAAKPVSSQSQSSSSSKSCCVALGLVERREGMHGAELAPGHRDHLGRGVELHGAGAERDHGSGRARCPWPPASAGSAASRSRRDRVEDRVGQELAGPAQRLVEDHVHGSRASSSSAASRPAWVPCWRSSCHKRLEVARGRGLVEGDAEAVGVDDAQVDPRSAGLGGDPRRPVPARAR